MTHIGGLVQERRNSSALAMELRLSCTNPQIYVSSAIFGSGSGLSPVCCPAIILKNADLLSMLIRPQGTNFIEMLF